MKDRWKIFTISLVVSLILTAFFLFMGFSLKQVGLRNYGILQYDFFRTVDVTQTVRINGNYLVGLDHSFIEYPRGIIQWRLDTDVMTQDKTNIRVEGLVLGRLIQSQVLNLHMAYGPAFQSLVQVAVQELFRQALQEFMLIEIIEQRAQITAYLSSYICLNLQSLYPFMLCEHVSLGQIPLPSTSILQSDPFVQDHYIHLLTTLISSQKKSNIYKIGGYDAVSTIQTANAMLFQNITHMIVDAVNRVPLNTTHVRQPPQEIFSAAAWIIDGGYIMPISNVIPVALE